MLSYLAVDRLSEAVEALIDATIAEGRSYRTVEGYRRNLAYLVAFLGDRPIAEVTIRDLRSYAAHLRSRSERYTEHRERVTEHGSLSPSTVASYIRAVKRLFNWLTEEGYLSENPAARLKNPAPPRHEPKAISMADFHKLLAATAGDAPMQRRDRALLLFLADTGCRAGGVANVRTQDVDLEHGFAKVIEKGSKMRPVPFSGVTREALQQWLEVRPSDKGLWLFVSLGSRGAGRLAPEGIKEVLRRLKIKAGVEGPCNPHSFRHGFAREYLRNGGDLSTLADLLGHSSVEVTWRFYSVFQFAELQERHSRFSPVARMAREGDDEGAQ